MTPDGTVEEIAQLGAMKWVEHVAAHDSGLRAASVIDTVQAGVLLRPATVAQIEATAHGGERMPPKTTFFHPKPKTGLVFRSLG